MFGREASPSLSHSPSLSQVLFEVSRKRGQDAGEVILWETTFPPTWSLCVFLCPHVSLPGPSFSGCGSLHTQPETFLLRQTCGAVCVGEGGREGDVTITASALWEVDSQSRVMFGESYVQYPLPIHNSPPDSARLCVCVYIYKVNMSIYSLLSVAYMDVCVY